MNLVDCYKRDGYVVLPNAVPESIMPRDKNSVHKQLKIFHNQSIERYLSYVRVVSKLLTVIQVFQAPAIQRFAEGVGIMLPLMQTTPAVHVMADDLKIPGGYDGIGAHQDWPAIQSSLNTMVVWVPWFDVGHDNYPVELVAGSHLNGLLSAQVGQHISEIDDAGMEYTPVPVKRGEALLFSAFTVHRTRTQGHGFRIAFSHRYEDALAPDFIERGFPSAQSRVIRRELITPDYPSIEQVQRVFS